MANPLSKERIMDFDGLQFNMTQLSLGGTVLDAGDVQGSQTDIDLGSSGTAGTLDIFPTTASKGKLAIVASDSAGNTTTTLTNASQTTTATMTIPDTNGSASFVMTAAAQTIGGAKTFSEDITLASAKTLNLASETKTLSSHAVTAAQFAVVVTTEALTTAAGASQAFVITLAGITAGDLAFVQDVGGTNTVFAYQYKAVTTTNTCTVTVYNSGPSDALNGTLKFNLWIVKA